MINQLQPTFSAEHQATADLMQRLIYPLTAYPWVAQDETSDLFYEALEAEWPEDTTLEAPEGFWQALEQQWQDVICPMEPKVSSDCRPLTPLTLSLVQKFQSLPQQLLSTITDNATTLGHQSLTMADRLVACVQDLFPHWASDDLYVLARPYAYAMRGGSPEPATQDPWESLSELEQVRLSLAAARAALEAAKNQPS
jgi:hypothetical protein